MVCTSLFLLNRFPSSLPRFLPPVLFAVLLMGLTACSGGPEGPVSALHHFKKGNEAYAIENYQRAISHFERALELDGNTAEIHYNLGLAYFHTENLERAVGAFQGALGVNPAMADAHYNLALAYDRLYDPTAAHSHFNTYRSLVAGRSKDQDGKKAVAGSRKNVATAGGLGAAAGLVGVKNGQKRLSKGAKTGANHRTGGRPSRSTAGRRGKPEGVSRRAQAAPAPGQSNTQAGDPNKWWTQDRFNQKP